MTKRVVIIGAGSGGTAVAGVLDKRPEVDLTLVDRRECMVHKIGGLRAAAQPDWQKKVLVPRDKLLKRGKLVRNTVSVVNATEVVFEDGTKLPYDILVCATGSNNASPGEPPAGAVTLKDMQAFYSATSAAIKRAKSIAIIGGGAVGVELSGELRSVAPDTKIALVHGSDKLLSLSRPPLPEAFQRKVKQQMASLNIDLHLGAKADLSPADFGDKPFLEGERTIKLANGKTVQADLVFNCMGNKLATSMYPAEWLDEHQAVKVAPTLLVNGTKNVFALGDITDIEESKLSYIASRGHAPVVAANVLAVAKGAPPSKTHKPATKPMMVVPLGSRKGVMVTPVGTFGPFLASQVKGKDLFVSMSWSANNAKAPR